MQGSFVVHSPICSTGGRRAPSPPRGPGWLCRAQAGLPRTPRRHSKEGSSVTIFGAERLEDILGSEGYPLYVRFANIM